jgi:hypothetical protein
MYEKALLNNDDGAVEYYRSTLNNFDEKGGMALTAPALFRILSKLKSQLGFYEFKTFIKYYLKKVI